MSLATLAHAVTELYSRLYIRQHVLATCIGSVSLLHRHIQPPYARGYVIDGGNTTMLRLKTTLQSSPATRTRIRWCWESILSAVANWHTVRTHASISGFPMAIVGHSAWTPGLVSIITACLPRHTSFATPREPITFSSSATVCVIPSRHHFCPLSYLAVVAVEAWGRPRNIVGWCWRIRSKFGFRGVC